MEEGKRDSVVQGRIKSKGDLGQRGRRAKQT